MSGNSKAGRSQHPRSALVMMLLAFLVLSSATCTMTLVQPFDQKLMSDTEAFYKKAAHMIIEGQAVSPRTSEDRDSIAGPELHPAHFSKFESEYDALIVDSEALFLRAMSGSHQIDAAGIAIQEKMNALIEAAIPTACPDLQAEFGELSLTARNFVDLKCLILRWKQIHRDKGILKKANWEGRKLTIFSAVFAIQKAESFKKERESK